MSRARVYPGTVEERSGRRHAEDALCIELPLQILVNQRLFSMTMQTPGDERYLVRGLLHAEGIPSPGFLSYDREETADGIVVQVEIDCHDKLIDDTRRLYASSSCGLCGKRSIGGLFEDVEPVRRALAITGDQIHHILQQQAPLQTNFLHTGGCHAACAATVDGEMLCVFEDIGRHNAVDKAIGFLLENKALERADVLTVSGRVSVEIVQKCARAGIPVLAAVSAPSSLAVDLAATWGLTLAAFCREKRVTFYTGLERLAAP